MSKPQNKRRDWSRAPLSPFLFAAHPILLLYAANIGSFPLSTLGRPIAVALGVTLLALGVLRCFRRDVRRAAVYLSLLVAMFFLYGHLREAVLPGAHFSPTMTAAILWFGLLMIGVALIWRLPDPAYHLPQLLNLIGVALVGLTLATILRVLLVPERGRGAEREEALSIQLHSLPSRAELPDIYYIILDGYARADVLQEMYGVNAELAEWLTDKGFYVASESCSNYAQTLLCLASTLNMEYIHVGVPPASDAHTLLFDLLANNRVSRLLQSVGYTRVVFPCAYVTTEYIPSDVYVLGRYPVTLFEYELFQLSVLRALEGLARHYRVFSAFSPLGGHIERTRFAFSNVGNIPEGPRPLFVFVHILCPHPPFVFDHLGRAKPHASWYLADASNLGLTPEQYRQGYLEQVEFVNHETQQLVMRLLSRPGPEPIIIIQGDHGPGSEMREGNLQGTNLRERMSILNAYYLPRGRERLYPQITPVNTFRVILSEYLGAQLPLLPDQSFFSFYRSPLDFVPYEPSPSGGAPVVALSPNQERAKR
ncbi:MAG: hypothetical protein ACUVX8_02605 [Candidatus Zipacnadales bacterium]